MSGTVIYCRTANGGMEAIERQLEISRRYGEDNGYTITDEYLDCDESGITIDRPELQRLLSDIHDGKVSRVIVDEPARLARNYLLNCELMGIFCKYGVEYISVANGGEIDMTWEKEIREGILALARSRKKKLRANLVV